MVKSLIELFERDLDRLIKEINLFTEEKNLWNVTASIQNSSGHLSLHICGNLNHFIGNVLGKTDFIRDREGEFNSAPVARGNLIQEITSVKQTVCETLEKLHSENLGNIYPIEVFQQPMSTEYFLIHLLGHLNYHLGQINYLRRALT